MRVHIIVLLWLMLLLGIFPRATSIEAQSVTIYVVAAQGLPLTGSDVKEIFLGDKTFSGSTKLVPVDNAGVRDAFLNKALGLSAGKYESIWTKKAFRDALNPPKLLMSDAEVIDYVKRTPAAVGYVGSAPSGVNVIQKY